MAQIDLKMVDGQRVTLAPFDGGRNVKVFLVGDPLPIGFEVERCGRKYQIVKAVTERACEVVVTP